VYSPEAGTRHGAPTRAHTDILHTRPHTTQSMTQRLPHSSAASATRPGAEGKRRKQIAIDNVNSPLYPARSTKGKSTRFRYSRGETTRKPVRSDSKL
jgi:hypothetical protein